MKTYGIGLVSFIGLFAMLAGCAEQGHRMSASEMSEKKRPNIKSQMVNLVVANNGRGKAELRITNARSEQCNKSSNDDRYLKGCIFAGLNDVVIAQFTLHGLADWYFDEFQICEAVNFQKPESFDACTLTEEHRKDWQVLANGVIAGPAADGRVRISQPGTELSQFELVDINGSAGNFFYRIQACKGTGSARTCVSTDPGGENTGNNFR